MDREVPMERSLSTASPFSLGRNSRLSWPKSDISLGGQIRARCIFLVIIFPSSALFPGLLNPKIGSASPTCPDTALATLVQKWGAGSAGWWMEPWRQTKNQGKKTQASAPCLAQGIRHPENLPLPVYLIIK